MKPGLPSRLSPPQYPEVMIITNERTGFSELVKVRQLQDLKVGDMVYTHQGRFRRVMVLNSLPFDGKMIRISPAYRPDILLTGLHHVLTISFKLDAKGYPRFNEEWKAATELRRGDLVCIPRPKRSDRSSYQWRTRQLKIGMTEHHRLAHRGPSHPHNRAKTMILHVTPQLMRLVGYYLSEGFAYHPLPNEGRVQFSFNKEGEERYVDDCANLLKEIFEVKPRIAKAESTTVVQVSSIHAFTFFSRYFGRTGPEKHLPRWVIRLPPSFLKELIKGWWRGDGTSSPNSFSGNSSYIDLASGLSLVLGRLGYLPSFLSYHVQDSKIGARIIKGGTTYLLSVTGKQRFRLSEVLDAPTESSRTGRTGQWYMKRFKKFWVPLKLVKEEDYKGPIYKVEVEQDHSYTLSGIAVHDASPL